MSNVTRRTFLRTGLASGATIAAGTVSSMALAAKPTKGLYIPGTYHAKAQGIGDVTVTMTFSESKITDVVLNLAGETPTIGQAASEKLKAALMAAQKAEVDVVSGATITSNAVMKAAGKCIAQAKGEIPVEVITAQADSDNDGDWLGKAPEIDEKAIVATHKTDVLVIGCGTGGLFAICAAAEKGAKVIGIDRFSVGTGIRDDVGGLNSRYQKAHGTHIDKLDFVTMMTQYATGHINQDLVKVFCENSGEVVDWYGDRLKERGVELWLESGDKNDQTRYAHFPIGHSPRWAGAKTADGKKLKGHVVLEDYARKHGARFDFNTKMVKLERVNGRVTGCIAENADGKYVRYLAKKGVVVATGGYAQNYKMLEALQPWNLRCIGRNGGLPGAKGDGIRACMWVGAAKDDTASTMLFDRCALRIDQKVGVETAKSGDSGFFWIGSQPWLKVNADGKRFMNESGTYENILHADEYQKGRCHYSLFDASWPEQTLEFKMHGCSRVHPFENGAEPNILWKVFQQRMLPNLIKKGFVVQADSIEELAQKLHLPVAELKKTVARYNALARKGKDEDYGKEAHRLLPLEKAPFYGAKNTGYILCTMDGIKINTQMNALDEDGNPIAGLYVVGNDSGGFFANTYPNLATGVACGRTVTFGYLVGRHLASL